MRRIMWVGVALLIMVAILGYGLYTLKNISEANKRHREKEAGKQDAIVIVSTEVPTTIWDKIHADSEAASAEQNSNAATPDAASTDEAAEPVDSQPDAEPAEQPAPETIIVSIS